MGSDLTYATLFSGVEGAGMGLEQAGMTQLWACERDKYCRGVLAYNYPDLHVYDDVNTLDAESVEVPDVLWMSPPCQDLSVAKKGRKGLAGERSGLFYVATKIAGALVRRGTRYVVMEQVPGLLSSHRGEDFRQVLHSFLELGAVDVGWRVLDSQWFGVPQRRKRLYFVLDFGGKRAGEILTLAQGLRRDAPPNRSDRQSDAYPCITFHSLPDDLKAAGVEIMPSVRVTDHLRIVHALQDTKPKYRVRRMTPLEYERGQGFSDYWTRYMIDHKGQTVEVSDAQRYKMCGNAVSTPVAKWIGQNIMR